jgi:hypothetical protein
MTNKKIITITLSLTIIHFVLTSLIGHYIAVQIGTQMGKIVAEGLIEASDKNTDNADEEAKQIHQNMKSKIDGIKDNWKIPNLLISLPAKPLINALLKEMRQNQMNKYIAKEITRAQFRTRGLITDYSANFVNSLCLGLLLYIGLKLSTKYRKRREHVNQGDGE